MKLLLDTHLLLWAAAFPERLPPHVQDMIEDSRNDLYFSVVAIWETAIKFGRGREDFEVDPANLRRKLLNNGIQELEIRSEHAVAVATLPLIHKDPFDRILIAQATVEGIILLTSDATVARYSGPIRLV
jgi:PIN domain nuclease of toxin-antitoxin system